MIGTGRILYDGGLADLKSRFARERRIKLQFLDECTEVPDIQGITSYESDGAMAEVRFLPDVIPASELIGRLSLEFPVRDLEIEPIEAEEMIAQLYKEYRI